MTPKAMCDVRCFADDEGILRDVDNKQIARIQLQATPDFSRNHESASFADMGRKPLMGHS
jgi:hypothetical protein